METPTILDYYANLPAPRKTASNSEAGKAFLRASDVIYERIIQPLDSKDLSEQAHFTRLLAELGINTFGAMVMESLTKNTLGREPRPDVVLGEFERMLEHLSATLWESVETEVSAKHVKDLQEKHKDLQCLYESLRGRYEAALELLDEISEPKEEIMNIPDQIRVSTLAKELGVASKDVLAALANIGRDDIHHHAQLIREPALIAEVVTHFQGGMAQPLTVRTVAGQLNVTTRKLIETLQAIDHVDLNKPDAVIYDLEIVDHVAEVLGLEGQAAA
jgi:hypothetical protein